MHRDNRELRPIIGYWLIQLPGLLLVVIIATIAASQGLISNKTAIIGLILWFIKELILYAVFVRTAWLYYPMGRETLIGACGEVISEITPDKPGQVRISGEIWSARSVNNSSFQPREGIKVVNYDGLTVFIKSAT